MRVYAKNAKYVKICKICLHNCNLDVFLIRIYIILEYNNFGSVNKIC